MYINANSKNKINVLGLHRLLWVFARHYLLNICEKSVDDAGGGAYSSPDSAGAGGRLYAVYTQF